MVGSPPGKIEIAKNTNTQPDNEMSYNSHSIVDFHLVDLDTKPMMEKFPAEVTETTSPAHLNVFFLPEEQ
jgi:hypothetical protein